MEKTLDNFVKLMEPYDAKGDIYLNYGLYDGDPFVIFESWDDLQFMNGILNGFEGNKDAPYLPKNETYEDLYVKAVNESKEYFLANGTENYNLKRRIDSLEIAIKYQNHLKTVDEVITIDDFDFEYGFSDEYDRCIHCGAIIRTSPDCYNWVPPLFVECEGYVCDECVESGEFDDYILENYANERRNLPRDPESLGLEKVNDESFQNGWYGGQRDTPEPIINALNDQDIDVWFVVYPRQFDLSFDVYVRLEDLTKAKKLLGQTDTKLDYDPADVLKKQLRSLKIS